MHFQKKITTSLLIFLLSFNLPVMASKLYSDIPAGHWAETAADVLGEENIMSGASSNEFGGNLPITRYDTAKILNGLMGNKSQKPGVFLLSDIRSGHPLFREIMNVLNAELMAPTNNKFSGEKKVSRYDFAKFIMNTLDYLQTEPISIRQPPKAIGNVVADKRDVINKAVNQWQLTEGYNDWDQNINRYGALEMVARAAININPDLRVRIGDNVHQGGVSPEPVKTPVPTAIPTPVYTPVATPEPTAMPTPIPTPVYTPVATPQVTAIPTPVPTDVPIPERTPVLSTPTPVPTVVVPTPVLSTPTPVPTPILTNSPEPVPTPIISIPTPVATPQVTVPIITNQVLRSQATLRGLYNFMYSESVPSVFPNETVKTKDDTLGPAIGGDISYWFNTFETPILKDMGVIVGFNALGSYIYPTDTALVKADTEVSETFKANVSILYKLYRSNDIEFAAGLDAFLRNTSRSSIAAHAVDSYWRASKGYIGIGARGLLGYRITDRIVLESSLFVHYVSQSINESITPAAGVAPLPAGSVIDRFNIELAVNGRWDLFQLGSNWLYADVNFDGRFLLGDGNQTIVGAGAGVGINY